MGFQVSSFDWTNVLMSANDVNDSEFRFMIQSCPQWRRSIASPSPCTWLCIRLRRCWETFGLYSRRKAWSFWLYQWRRRCHLERYSRWSRIRSNICSWRKEWLWGQANERVLGWAQIIKHTRLLECFDLDSDLHSNVLHFFYRICENGRAMSFTCFLEPVHLSTQINVALVCHHQSNLDNAKKLSAIHL